MKCGNCTKELYKRIKKESGKDKQVIEARMEVELPSLPDAKAIIGQGWPVCLKHYIAFQGW